MKPPVHPENGALSFLADQHIKQGFVTELRANGPLQAGAVSSVAFDVEISRLTSMES
jgi:hypothetical protein